MTDTTLDLPAILAAHKLWLDSDHKEGARANLARAYLIGANLSGANLSGANLDSAYLDGANLDGANLAHAYLAGADLYGANLSGANLDGVNLSGANLSGANLDSANLDGANLSGAYLAHASLIDGGRRLDGYYFVGQVKNGTLWIKAGCRYFPIAEARKHWSDTRGGTRLGDETMAILDYIERLAAIRENV